MGEPGLMGGGCRPGWLLGRVWGEESRGAGASEEFSTTCAISGWYREAEGAWRINVGAVPAITELLVIPRCWCCAVLSCTDWPPPAPPPCCSCGWCCWARIRVFMWPEGEAEVAVRWALLRIAFSLGTCSMRVMDCSRLVWSGWTDSAYCNMWSGPPPTSLGDGCTGMEMEGPLGPCCIMRWPLLGRGGGANTNVCESVGVPEGGRTGGTGVFPAGVCKFSTVGVEGRGWFCRICTQFFMCSGQCACWQASLQ